jgi:prefoldin subunit 5
MADDAVEALRAENRRLRAAVKHLQDELANAQERIAFLSQELARVRAKLPPGLSTG